MISLYYNVSYVSWLSNAKMNWHQPM